MTDNSYRPTDPMIVETWIKGWSAARHTAPPVPEEDCFRVDVGWPQQKRRYVFPRLCEAFHTLAGQITDPWVFLKVCAAPELVAGLLPAGWVLQPLRYMMICTGPMLRSHKTLPGGYRIGITEEEGITVVRIDTAAGEIAAIGRVVVVNGYAIYDRIETHPGHRRRGLAAAVMQTLERIVLEQGISRGILVATAEGKALYHTLGWQLHSLYTTAVIPGPEEGPVR